MKEKLKEQSLESIPNKLKEDECTLQTLKINFSNIPVIIYPKIITINKCIGTCELFTSNKFSNHAKLMAVIGSSSKSNLNCIPNSYKSIVLVFWDNFENIIFKRYYNMIAQSCECR